MKDAKIWIAFLYSLGYLGCYLSRGRTTILSRDRTMSFAINYLILQFFRHTCPRPDRLLRVPLFQKLDKR